jgi:hypothetical protein
MFTKTFWVDATERALSTAAQAALLALGGGSLNVLTADWQVVGGFALGGAVLSYLKSIVAARLTGTPDGSLVK